MFIVLQSTVSFATACTISIPRSTWKLHFELVLKTWSQNADLKLGVPGLIDINEAH